MMRKSRTAELEVGRHLAYLGAIHHQTEVLRFDMLSTGTETVVHRGLQTNLMARGTSLYAGLHGTFLHGVFAHSAFLHGTFLHGLLSIHGILLS
jgi:hypothetical protein